LPDHLDKAQGLKDVKVAPSVHENMRPLGAQLRKGKRLARLVGKSSPRLRVAKQMIQTVASHHGQHIKDDRTMAGRTELLELPAATFHLFIVLLDLRTLFLMAYDPRRIE
jgi:hypothetical protein